MTTISDVERNKVRDEAFRDLIAHVTANTKDPERIGRRILAMKWKLFDSQRGESNLHFARRMGVTESAASQAVSAAEACLYNLRYLNRATNDAS